MTTSRTRYLTGNTDLKTHLENACRPREEENTECVTKGKKKVGIHACI